MGEDYRIGIDVGGTNTDAALLDADLNVVACAKTPTTSDLNGGMLTALTSVLEASRIDPRSVTRAMLGTTHATNAVLERRDLSKVVAIRVAGPATGAVPPFATWPDDLRTAVSAGSALIDGGFEYSGREQVPFDEDQLRRFLGGLEAAPDACAITSIFATVSGDHERRAASVVREMLGPDVHITLSSTIGTIGLLERENASILNAALRCIAIDIVDGFQRTLDQVGINATPYFAQNDGTLMSLDRGLEYPVLTIGSGPANSMRGAAYLTGLSDAIVVDVGGTSTDVGALASGFPRESAIPVEIGGVRTNFRMPDLLATALGGGTIVRSRGESLELGPDSVGHRLTTEALSFGGATVTLTDAAVRAGRAAIGTRHPSELASETASEAIRQVDATFADTIDRIKLTQSDLPVIAVGGGSVLIPDEMEGVSAVHRPEHFDVANAIGAAIAYISAEIDRIYQLGPGGREEIAKLAREEVTASAIALGADPSQTSIVAFEELTMAYVKDDVLRVRVKAAGPLVQDVSANAEVEARGGLGPLTP